MYSLSVERTFRVTERDFGSASVDTVVRSNSPFVRPAAHIVQVPRSHPPLPIHPSACDRQSCSESIPFKSSSQFSSRSPVVPPASSFSVGPVRGHPHHHSSKIERQRSRYGMEPRSGGIPLAVNRLVRILASCTALHHVRQRLVLLQSGHLVLSRR